MFMMMENSNVESVRFFFDSEGALEEHRKIQHKKKCMCTSCGMRFERKIDLSRHLKERHEERPLKCPCNTTKDPSNGSWASVSSMLLASNFISEYKQNKN